MIKRIVIVLVAIILLLGISFSVHKALLSQEIAFSMFNVYLFHAICVILIYATVELVADKLPNQAGYAYLMLMFFKIGAFVLIFQSSVFSKEILSQSERIALVAPLFIFLIAEAIAVAKLLNSK